MIGNTLEEEWGSFRFNVYYFSGMLAAIAGAFAVGASTGVFLNLSLFLAFAFLYPNFEIRLFFILPVKIKYLAGLYWVILAYTIGFGGLSAKVMAFASVVNFFLFFGIDLVKRLKLRNQVQSNRRRFYAEIAKSRPVHQCAVCGTTEKKEPRMDFAYCKECDEEYEYCTRHIANHEHKRHADKQ